MNVVYDQVGSPTYAKDLALAILKIIPALKSHEGVEIFHYANEGVASWFDFARAVIEFSGISCRISPIETKDYPLPASRPFYSVLNKSKIKERFGLDIPYWRDSLDECVKKIAK
jgi:dTDP-4-dehydrorhamnose reductase